MTNYSDSDNTMDKILKETLDVQVPPEVETRARQRLEAFRVQMESRLAQRRQRSSVPFLRRWGKAIAYAAPAAVLLLTALIFLLIPGGKISAVALADVLKRVSSGYPFTYKITSYEQGKPRYTTHVMEWAPGRKREIRGYDGRIWIWDSINQPDRVLILDEARKIATEMTLPKPLEYTDLLDYLRGLQNKAEKKVGQEKINGRIAEVFRSYDVVKDREGREWPHDYTVWVDPKTWLPIRMELVQEKTGTGQVIWSDFVFNAKLDESLFSTTPPKGYQVVKTASGPPHAY